MKSFIFAKRNFKEITRDPLSYIFCLVFPIVMLVVFQVINTFLPEAAWFSITDLTPGICVFSFSFLMLFSAQLISKDKNTAFLNRLYTSNLKMSDYVLGYIFPLLLIGIVQAIICYSCSFVISLFRHVDFSIWGAILSIVLYIPEVLFFIATGLIFGTIFSDKAAPGLSSVIISASSILSGAWMPLSTMGKFEDFCRCLPFYPGVYYGRTIFSRTAINFDNFWLNIIIVLIYVIVLLPFAILMFKRMINSDKK